MAPIYPLLTQTRYQVYTIWLFTASDIKTIVLPQSLFGIIGFLSEPLLIQESESQRFPRLYTPHRLSIIFLWVWINLLPFAISNQQHPSAILEDNLNKPWRPLPSGRCTPQSARVIMLIAYLLAIVFSYFVGSLNQCLLLIVFGYWYNNLQGAEDFLIRIFINACGYTCFGWGAMESSFAFSSNNINKPNPTMALTPQAYRWLLIIASVIFTTVSMQDLSDQAGDKLRGRKTMPLLFGDKLSRYILSMALMFWSIWIPLYWEVHYKWFGPVLGVVIVIIYRTICKRSVEQDKMTFRIWNFWVVLLYLFPLIKRFNEMTDGKSCHKYMEDGLI